MYILYIFTIKNNFLLLNFIYIIFTILYIYLNIKKIHIYVYIMIIYLNVNIIKSINFNIKKIGPLRDLNPGPPAPKAGIILLDQEAS